MHPAIKLRHLRTFLDIAAEENLSAVARRHGISQPALSRTLAELEDLLGTQLFDRTGRKLVLTADGQVLRRTAASALGQLDAGVAELGPKADLRELRVGALPTVASRFLPRVALGFHKVAPDTCVSVETGPHSYLLACLRDGSIDLVLGRMPAPAEMPDLSFVHLFEEEVLLVARAGNPLKDAPIREVLTGSPLILPLKAALIRRAVDDYLSSLGLTTLRPAFETVALAMGRGLVLGSDAVWFISKGVVLSDLDRGDLISIPTGVSYLSGSVGITRRQGKPRHPDVDLLVQIARENAQKSDSDGALPFG
jgi:LysR family transcriptional regulator, pca operon transcriptional activator